MPYVKQESRDRILSGFAPETAGELNFLLTCEAINYVKHQGVSYSAINDVLGAFEGAKLEFARRVMTPYENRKCAENGDVYPAEMVGK